MVGLIAKIMNPSLHWLVELEFELGGWAGVSDVEKVNSELLSCRTVRLHSE